MITQPAVSSRRRVACLVAALAATVVGAGYVQTASPTGSLLAECFDGQTVDPTTGSCPQDSSVANPDSSGDSAAVKGAEAGNQADESLIGSR